MIHVPVILGLKVASVIFRNRASIAQGVRDIWGTPSTEAVATRVEQDEAESNPNEDITPDPGVSS